MTEVYQTILTKGKGNCMQAAMASLFDEKLENIPNFIEKANWFHLFCDYPKSKGYRYEGILSNSKWIDLENPKSNVFYQKDKVKRSSSLLSLKRYKGVNGLFYAIVCSPKRFQWEEFNFHAVIVDKDCNIVFDPNPDYKGRINRYPFADFIGYNGIVKIYLFEKSEE